jgi:hypothetical protein
VKGWVVPRELAELNRLQARAFALLRGARKPRDGGRLMSLTWVHAPVPAKPPRRGTEA